MSSAPGNGWLSFGGIEVFNNDRALSYAQNGMGGVSWDVLLDRPMCDCWANSVYTCDTDTHSAGDPMVFTLPSGQNLESRTPPLYNGDVAPWYTDSFPTSNEFYGVFVNSISGLDNVPYSRTVSQTNNMCGGIMKGPNVTGRELVVSGTLFAGSCDGLEYGKRWLNDVLLSGCDDFGAPFIDVQLYCPEEGSDYNAGIRRLYNTGVLQMPQYRPETGKLCCTLCDFTMIFYAENPYLHRLDEQPVLDTARFDFDNDLFNDTCCDQETACLGKTYAVSALMETPTFVSSAALRIEIEPGCVMCVCPVCVDGEPVPGTDFMTMDEYTSLDCEPAGATGVPQNACMMRVTVAPSRFGESPKCPDSDALVDFYIREIPAGQKFVLDSATNRAYFADSHGNFMSSALSQVQPAAVFDIFPSIAPCAKVVVQVSGSQCGMPQDTKVSCYRIDKEM